MTVTLYTSYGKVVGTFEIAPFNGAPSAIFYQDRIYVKWGGGDTNRRRYREGHYIVIPSG